MRSDQGRLQQVGPLQHGYTGTLNWNSTGTLDPQGKLRVGEGGTGVLNQRTRTTARPSE